MVDTMQANRHMSPCKVAMKSTLILAVAMGSLILVDCKSRSASASNDNVPPSNDTALFLDNIAYKDDGEEFANAFAQEPSCSGLSLMLWTDHTAEERMRGMKARWWVSYAHVGSRVASVRVQQKDTGMIDGARTRTPAEAARWVCSIVKGSGGQGGDVQ